MKSHAIITIAVCAISSGCAISQNSAPKVERVSREDWKAYEVVPAKPDQYRRNSKIKYITIHHTHSPATSETDSEAQLLRNVQDGHRFVKWGKDKKYAPKTDANGVPLLHYGDIAYHYIVGHSSKIYMGRSEEIAGASYTYYLSEDERKGLKVDGGQIQVPKNLADKPKPGHIDGHLTVSFLCKDEVLPDKAMKNAASLVAELLVENGLTPDDVRAHRELANTACPGDQIYIWLRGREKSLNSQGDGMKLILAEYQRLKQ